MDQATHNKIVSFIQGIADDVPRDFFNRGKYPDVTLNVKPTIVAYEPASDLGDELEAGDEEAAA